MLPFSLNRLYAVLHSSRQSFHQRRARIRRLEEQQAQLLPILREWRERHPGMSVRLLYDILHPDCMGRDRFEQFCLEQGFQVSCTVTGLRLPEASSNIRFPICWRIFG